MVSLLSTEGALHHHDSRSSPWESDLLKSHLAWSRRSKTSTHALTGYFKLSDPECIEAMLDLAEAFPCVSRKCIRLLDVRGFKDAGMVFKGFHHVGTHSKNVNMSAIEWAGGSHGQPLPSRRRQGCLREWGTELLGSVAICTGGRHRSVMCAELVDRFLSMQGIDS